MTLSIDTTSKDAGAQIARYNRLNCPISVQTQVQVYDGDWKTDVLHRKPSIPKGTTLLVNSFFYTGGNIWANCIYRGRTYRVDIRYIEPI